MRPQVNEIAKNREAGLVAVLTGRVAALEARITQLERLLSGEQSRHAGVEMILRHEVANETQTTDAVLMWAEGAPEKLQEMIPLIKAAREERARRIALEKGAMAGANVSGSEK